MKQKKLSGRERFRKAIKHLNSLRNRYPEGRIIKNYLIGRGDKRVVTVGLYCDRVNERGDVKPEAVELPEGDNKIMAGLADEAYKTKGTHHTRYKFFVEPVIYMVKINYDAAWGYHDYTNDPGRVMMMFDLADWKKYAKKNFGDFEFPNDYINQVVKGGMYDGGYVFEYKGYLIGLSCHSIQQAKRLTTGYRYKEGR